MEELKCRPIGSYFGRQSEKYMAPKQSGLGGQNEGRIVLYPDHDFEQALEDLHGFERIWVIYWFHRNHTWKHKVNTPRGGAKRGVFATRSPHRPNPIGLSAVELLGVEGRVLRIGKSDLIDGTPILDIKPYLCYADAFPESGEGWTNNEREGDCFEGLKLRVEWSDQAKAEACFIEEKTGLPLIETVELRLGPCPAPSKSNRIKQIDKDLFRLAFKTWRVVYSQIDSHVKILKIVSGYDEATLAGSKTSRWSDVPLHIEFSSLFD